MICPFKITTLEPFPLDRTPQLIELSLLSFPIYEESQSAIEPFPLVRVFTVSLTVTEPQPINLSFNFATAEGTATAMELSKP